MWGTQATRAPWDWSLLGGPGTRPCAADPSPSASAPARGVLPGSRARGGRGEGNEPLLARSARPAPPRRLTWAQPHLLGGGAWPGAWPAGPGRARRSRGGSGRLLIPGIPRAPALASAAEPARRAPSACACGCAEGAPVRERGRERACASVRPRSAPRARGGTAPAPTGPCRPEAGGRARSRLAVSAGGPAPGEGWPAGERRVGLTRSGTEDALLPGGGGSFLAGTLEAPGGNRSAPALGGRCAAPGGVPEWKASRESGRSGRKGARRPASLLVLAGGTGGLCAGRAEDGQPGPVSFLSVDFLPPPQNQTTHSSCTSAGLAEKQRSPFCVCVLLKAFFDSLH